MKKKEKESFDANFEAKRRFRECRERLRKLLREKKNRSERHQFDELEESKENDSRKFFRQLKMMRGAKKRSGLPERMVAADRSITRSATESRSAWQKYYSALGRHDNDNTTHFDEHFKAVVEEKVRMADREGAPARHEKSTELSYPISVSEVSSMMRSVRSGKAPGPDGIRAEFLVRGGSSIQAALHSLFDEIFSAGRVPEQWLTAHVVPIYKSGSRTVMDNYRPI